MRRLRVVDASVFPHVTNANVNAPTMILALRGATKILKAHRRRRKVPRQWVSAGV
jgi:choline dehydrogenase